MLKMLIVDDEINIINGLLHCIEWNKLGINSIDTARNGLIAFEMAMKNKYDLIISDISMPLMDGVELAKKIYENGQNCRIIFITAFWEKKYIKSAFKSRVVDYILKPINIDELYSTVSKTVIEINENINKESYFNNLEIQYNENLPYLREKFLYQLISNSLPDKKQIKHKIDNLKIEIPLFGAFTVLCIKIDNYFDINNNNNNSNMHLISIAVVNIGNEIIQNYTKGYCFHQSEDTFICIIHFDDNCFVLDRIEKLALKLKEALNSILKIEFTIGIGEWVSSMSELNLSYNRAIQATTNKFFTGNNKIFFADKVFTKVNPSKFLNLTHFSIDVNLKAGNIEKVYSEIDMIFNKIKEMNIKDTVFAISICIQLYLEINNVLLETQLSNANDLNNITSDICDILKSQSLGTIKELIINKCKYINDMFVEERNSYNKTIKTIKDIIEENYDKQLTIKEISEKVYFSSSYICLLFKQETSMTINQYITKIRIDKACSLILSTNKTVLDICYDVGYSDPKYFSKLFKKVTGFLPTEYKSGISK